MFDHSQTVLRKRAQWWIAQTACGLFLCERRANCNQNLPQLYRAVQNVSIQKTAKVSE